MRALVIRHHETDDAGFLADAFAARGWQVSTHLYPADGPLPPPEDADHVVLLGAAYAIYDDGSYAAAIAAELRWLRDLGEAFVPVLGVCFGAQALTITCGGKVVPAQVKEIGWTTIDTVDARLIPAGPWLEFHGDICLLPPEARVLASTPLCVQAFTIGRNLAVQFHPEVDGAQLKRWLESGGRAEAEQAGKDADALLARTIAEEPEAARRADQLVEVALRLAAEQRAADGSRS
jgi:GMP synthase-like glutamine amidotransferase